MNGNIFQEVKDGLQPRLDDVVQELLPGGRISGKEYLCASLQGAVWAPSAGEAGCPTTNQDPAAETCWAAGAISPATAPVNAAARPRGGTPLPTRRATNRPLPPRSPGGLPGHEPARLDQEFHLCRNVVERFGAAQ